MSFVLLGILNSQAAGGGAPAIPAMELISSQVLSSTTSTVTFGSIPQSFKHLHIRYSVRSAISSGGRLATRINSVSSNVYYRADLYHSGTSLYSEFTNGTSSMTALRMPGTSELSNFYATGYMDILNYTTSEYPKELMAVNGHWNMVEQAAGGFENFSTAPVNSISFFDFNGGSGLLAGTRISIYGVQG